MPISRVPILYVRVDLCLLIGSLFCLACKGFARKYNLGVHIRTHDKGAPKLFGCWVCHRGFDRKHDRARHLKNIHKIPKSSLSAPSAFSRRFDITPDLPQAQYRTTAVGGEEQLPAMLLPHPGSFSDAGLEDLTAHWGHATWLQGV
jgi:hypothetical protein